MLQQQNLLSSGGRCFSNVDGVVGGVIRCAGAGGAGSGGRRKAARRATRTAAAPQPTRSTSPTPRPKPHKTYRSRNKNFVANTTNNNKTNSTSASGGKNSSTTKNNITRRGVAFADPPASSSQDEDAVVSNVETASAKTTTNSTMNVTHIVSDVDGTLLNSEQELTIRTEVAVARAAACGVPLILATGKSRGPWSQKVLSKMPIPMPGVFIQGLLTCDADGTVLESIELDVTVAASIVRFAEQQNKTLIAFCGGRILCAERNNLTDRVLDYGEPEPEPVGCLIEGCLEAGIAVNKLLLFASEEDMPAVRADAETMFEGDCSITTAVPGMLEFLPVGASKVGRFKL